MVRCSSRRGSPTPSEFRHEWVDWRTYCSRAVQESAANFSRLHSRAPEGAVRRVSLQISRRETCVAATACRGGRSSKRRGASVPRGQPLSARITGGRPPRETLWGWQITRPGWVKSPRVPDWLQWPHEAASTLHLSNSSSCPESIPNPRRRPTYWNEAAVPLPTRVIRFACFSRMSFLLQANFPERERTAATCPRRVLHAPSTQHGFGTNPDGLLVDGDAAGSERSHGACTSAHSPTWSETGMVPDYILPMVPGTERQTEHESQETHARSCSGFRQPGFSRRFREEARGGELSTHIQPNPGEVWEGSRILLILGPRPVTWRPRHRHTRLEVLANAPSEPRRIEIRPW